MGSPETLDAAIAETYDAFVKARSKNFTLGDLKDLLEQLVPEGQARQTTATMSWFFGPEEHEVLRDQYDECMTAICQSSLAAGILESKVVEALSTIKKDLECEENIDPTTQENDPSNEENDPSTQENDPNTQENDSSTQVTDANTQETDTNTHGAVMTATLPPFIHPSGSRDFLESTLVPKLREGLIEMVAEMEKEQLKVASGCNWDHEGYLPKGWKPFSPFRWLGKWLLSQSPSHTGGSGVSYGSYSFRKKAALIHGALDIEKHGFLHVDDVCEKLKVSRPQFDAVLHDLGHDAIMLRTSADGSGGEEGLVRGTFVQLMVSMFGNEPLYTQDTLVHRALGHDMASYCLALEDKYRLMFLALDGGLNDYRGTLPTSQLTQLASRMDISHEEVLQALQMDEETEMSTQLTYETFVSAVASLLGPTPEVDRIEGLMMAALALARGIPAEVAALIEKTHAPIDEVEPSEFADYIRALPGFADARMVRSSEALDFSFAARTSLTRSSVAGVAYQGGDSAPDDAASLNSVASVVFIDVRSSEEVQVSHIPGSVHVMVQQSENSDGLEEWSISNPSKLKEKLEAVGMGRSSKVIVYCNTGRRSMAVAAQLEALLEVEVSSLCGGLINYFNQGGCVKAPNELVVQAVHPGGVEFKDYVTRPNTFKF